MQCNAMRCSIPTICELEDSSREHFSGNTIARAFAFPFVIFTEQRFVLFQLRFDFTESFFAAGAEMFVCCGGVERAGGESEIQGESVFVFAWNFRKNGVQLNEIRLVSS